MGALADTNQSVFSSETPAGGTDHARRSACGGLVFRVKAALVLSSVPQW
jgi:hypothetical protein